MILANKKILIVDDDDFALSVLSAILKTVDCIVIKAKNAQYALSLLESGQKIDAIVLDRKMEGMDGLTALKMLKENHTLRNIPVIMQTSMAESDDIKAGLEAGAYQYLIKPINDQLLIRALEHAMDESRQITKLLGNLKMNTESMGLMQSSYFKYQTPDESKNLSLLLASCFPDPESAIIGLNELMINAIEHGNLGIDYNEKVELVKNGNYPEEIVRCLELEENKDKYAIILFERYE